jgi:RNA polymerase sigma factor (sigma-70 family)
MIDQIGHVYSKYQELQQKLGHDPKVEELAEAMDMTVEKVREAFRASANPISLETPVGSDEENTLGDLLSNQQEEAPADVAERTLLSDYLDDALEELTPRERMVLRMRFGISDQRPRTLGEIGQVIGVSRERVRQLEAEAIANQSRTIRVPVHMIDQIGHVYSKYQELQQKLGHDPKVEELAAAMDMTVEKVREAFRASANPISLETPVGSDEENTLGDLLSNQQEEAPADVAERTLLSDYLDDALEELTTRERMVLRMRFGISDQRPRTLGEIGQVIGVSRERVRQLEAEAIAKLRKPNLRLRLAEYLE